MQFDFDGNKSGPKSGQSWGDQDLDVSVGTFDIAGAQQGGILIFHYQGVQNKTPLVEIPPRPNWAAGENF